MQASKNLSDAWLAHWIVNVNPTNLSSAETLNPKLFGSKYYMWEIKRNALCILDKILWLNDVNRCATNLNGFKNDTFATSYYLVIYILIAVFNSLITLLRSFAFAYAGLKAAKFIHTKLLNNVFYVSVMNSGGLTKL